MTIPNFAVLVVGCIHLMIAVVEIFLWRRPEVYSRGGLILSESEAHKVSPIVANAGLYNSFLGVGLVWSALGPAELTLMKLYLLSCVIVAGLFGALTLKKWTILLIQSVPAIIALYLVASMK
jgi:putative membrane protein